MITDDSKLIPVVMIFFMPLLYCQELHGTAALVIWTPERAIIAADSKVTKTNGGPATVACKIRNAGKFSFALSGFYGNREFDAWALVAEAISSAQTVPEAASLSERLVLPRLKQALQSFKSDDPFGFAAAFKESYFAVFFAGIDSNKPVLAGWQLLTTGEVLKDAYPGTHPITPGAVGFNTFGEHDAIDSTYHGRALNQLLKDPRIAARTLIQLEIDREPNKVGAPRSILEISRAGRIWIEAGVCK